MTVLVIDFETYDPYINKLGSGWVHGQMEVIGASLRFSDWPTAKWTDSKDKIIELVNTADTLICHNLQYDVGILIMWGVDISKKKLVDTMILAKMYDSTLTQYGLDALASKYLNQNKAKNALGQAVIKHNLYQTATGKKQRTKCLKKANKYGIEHMHEVYKHEPKLVIHYANQDVNLTWDLYRFFPSIGNYWSEIVNRMFHILLKCRKKGVRIDIDQLKESEKILRNHEMAVLNKIRQTAGKYTYYKDGKEVHFNPLSSVHVTELLYQLNIPHPFTAKGNPSATSKWLETQTHPICKQIVEYKQYRKARSDFCTGVLEYQELLPEGLRGRVYPEFKLFGAAPTGRLSCAKPNIQQIPKHHEIIGPLIRAIYIADEGETWCSLDFSQQEYRIFGHYAELVVGDSIACKAYLENPNEDFHTFVAELCDITRDEAKAINYGILYGMGVDKLAISLNVSKERAKHLIGKYHEAFTDVKRLSRVCCETGKQDKFITTMKGRRLRLDKPVMVPNEVGYETKSIKQKDGSIRVYTIPVCKPKLVTFEYKMLNKLLQGSSADQIMIAMIRVDNAGIPMLFSVHDELNLSLRNRADAEIVRDIMINSLDLKVPMVSDIGYGDNWAQAK